MTTIDEAVRLAKELALASYPPDPSKFEGEARERHLAEHERMLQKIAEVGLTEATKELTS